jgi:thioredoxin 1
MIFFSYIHAENTNMRNAPAKFASGSAVCVLASVFLFNIFCGPDSERSSLPALSKETAADGIILVTNNLDLDFSKHLITFIELGADRCIPCKAMQPIMKEIAAEYAGKVQVVFYDVWKDPEPGRQYGIQLIPTQVFLDKTGKELFRHTGLFPKNELIEFLKKQGVN